MTSITFYSSLKLTSTQHVLARRPNVYTLPHFLVGSNEKVVQAHYPIRFCLGFQVWSHVMELEQRKIPLTVHTMVI